MGFDDHDDAIAMPSPYGGIVPRVPKCFSERHSKELDLVPVNFRLPVWQYLVIMIDIRFDRQERSEDKQPSDDR